MAKHDLACHDQETPRLGSDTVLIAGSQNEDMVLIQSWNWSNVSTCPHTHNIHDSFGITPLLFLTIEPDNQKSKREDEHHIAIAHNTHLGSTTLLL